MNQPQNLARKIREELEEHPFPSTIDRLNAKQAEQLETQKNYATLLETAASLPSVLDTRIAELRQRIEHETAVQQTLIQLKEERRQSDFEALKRLQAQCDEGREVLEAEWSSTTAKWGRAEQLGAELSELKLHDGLNADQRGVEEIVELLQLLPFRTDSRAAADPNVSADDLWERLQAIVGDQEQPKVPLYDMFPSVRQFLAPAK